MSWKNFLSAGLLCVLASPAFAAPSMGIVKGGTAASGNLDASGNWVSTVQVTADQTIVTGGGGTPLAVELGLTSSSAGAVAGQGNLISATNATAATFDYNNPGTLIFTPTWETTYGTPLKPEGLEINCATGSGCTGAVNAATLGGHAATTVTGTVNQIFAALGSANITSSAAQNMLTIVTKRPAVSLASPNTTQTLTVSGAYNSGKGRIAQISGATSANFDTFNGVFTHNAHGGDSDLDGVNDFADFQLRLLPSINTSGKTWQDGDYSGDGTVDFADFQILLVNLNTSYAVGAGAGSGLGSGGAVPEPASIALVGLALLSGLGLVRRKR